MTLLRTCPGVPTCCPPSGSTATVRSGAGSTTSPSPSPAPTTPAASSSAASGRSAWWRRRAGRGASARRGSLETRTAGVTPSQSQGPQGAPVASWRSAPRDRPGSTSGTRWGSTSSGATTTTTRSTSTTAAWTSSTSTPTWSGASGPRSGGRGPDFLTSHLWTVHTRYVVERSVVVLNVSFR